ncbi:MAG: polysaccharide deacetylase family protein, partial [Gammaproteobacteria bacterium]
DQAYPVLRKYGIPATIYVSLDYLDGKRSFWYERLEDLIDKTRAERLDMTAERLGRYDLVDAPSRQRAMVELNRQLKLYPEARRERLLETMMQRLGVTEVNQLSPMLDWRMVREMAAQGVSIGSHTLSHVILSHESIARVRAELRDSRARLEGILNAEVTSFAYPNGNAAGFNAAVIAEVESAGYGQACTTIPGINRAGANPFTLRRVNLHAKMCTDGAGRFDPALFWSKALGVM